MPKSEFVLTELTKSSEILLLHKNNYVEWGQAANLSLEQYVRRENLLFGSEYSKIGNKKWILQKSDEGPISQDKILAQCETYECEAVLNTGNTSEILLCYSLGSVFVPTKHRKKGYATRMLSLLTERFGTLNSGKLVVSNLYSDIGPDFYSRLGWRVYDSRHTDFLVSGTEDTVDTSKPFTKSDFRTVAALLDKENERIAKKMSRSEENEIFLTLRIECFEWHWIRCFFYAQVFRGISEEQSIPLGVALETENDFALWTLDFPNQKLVFLYWTYCSLENAEQLVRMAISTARVYSLGKVVVGNVEQSVERGLIAQIGNAKSVTRTEESLNSLGFFGFESEGIQGKSVNWLCNFKYGWV